jgi:hypothetical protein
MTIANILAEVQPGLLPPPALIDHEELAITVPLQGLDNWCWAAVTAGIEVFFDVPAPRPQCRIVNDVLGVGGCCPESTASPQVCNRPSAPQPALRDLFLERVDSRDGGATFPFVSREIVGRGLPFIANIGYNDSRIGHLVVVSGFRRVGPIVKLVVWDPYLGASNEEKIDAFRRSYRSRGRWRASYRLQRPQPVQ